MARISKNTYRYETLEGAIRNSMYGRITMSDFVTGRFIHKNNGWSGLELSDKAKLQFATLIANYLWAKNIGEHITDIMRYHGSNYGIFRRLYVNRDFEADYDCGQEYNGEIRHMQSLIRNNR